MSNNIIKKELFTDDLCTALFSYRLKVKACGVLTCYNNSSLDDYSQFYRLYYMIQGNASYTINNGTHQIERRTVIYLPPNHELDLTQLNEGELCQLYFVTFEIGNIEKREEFHQLMTRLFPHQSIHDEHSLIAHYFNRIYNEAADQQAGYNGFIQSTFQIILILMVRLAKNRDYKEIIRTLPTKRDNPLITKATHYIFNQVKQNIKINELARELGISEIYLYKLFKEHLGKSPQQYLNDYRVQLAKEYLSSSYYSIRMIAEELGYSSSNHFSKAFKNATGLSPNQWRTQLKFETS